MKKVYLVTGSTCGIGLAVAKKLSQDNIVIINDYKDIDKDFIKNNFDNKKNVGKSIKEKRLENGLSQQELANKIGVTHAAISFWENNVNVPNVLDCWKIADVLKISIDELVGRTM